jgi:hypothetical protein
MNGSMPVTKIVNPARWRDWARSLARLPETSQAVVRRKQPLQMALLRRARTGARIHRHSHLYQHIAGWSSILFRPTIRLTLNAPSPVTRILRLASMIHAAPYTRPAEAHEADTARVTDTTVLRQKTLRLTDSSVRTVFQQISERTRRLEERVSMRTTFASKTNSSDSHDAQSRQHRPGSQEWWKSEPSLSPRQPSMPAMNIEQITDTVLRQLDHRVSSWRERMGRV